jgi:hypothetical protein
MGLRLTQGDENLAEKGTGFTDCGKTLNEGHGFSRAVDTSHVRPGF